MYLVRSWKMAEQSHKSHQRQLAVMLLMSRPRWTFRFGLRGGKWIGLIVSRARKCRNESLNVVQPHGDQGHGRGRRRPAEGVAQLQDRQVAVISPFPLLDAGDRGSDLAVTAPELNAGAGVGRLPNFGDLWRSKSVLR